VRERREELGFLQVTEKAAGGKELEVKTRITDS
jgi:hypothetical protein